MNNLFILIQQAVHIRKNQQDVRVDKAGYPGRELVVIAEFYFFGRMVSFSLITGMVLYFKRASNVFLAFK
jgi:hypothetical protein